MTWLSLRNNFGSEIVDVKYRRGVSLRLNGGGVTGLHVISASVLDSYVINDLDNYVIMPPKKKNMNGVCKKDEKRRMSMTRKEGVN